MHCTQTTSLPNEYERTCIPCGYNVIKQKPELSKTQREELNFDNRLKNAEKNVLCI